MNNELMFSSKKMIGPRQNNYLTHSTRNFILLWIYAQTKTTIFVTNFIHSKTVDSMQIWRVKEYFAIRLTVEMLQVNGLKSAQLAMRIS